MNVNINKTKILHCMGSLRELVTLKSNPAEHAGEELEATRTFAVLAVNGSIADIAVLEAD